jgi:predicted RNA binding protein YcfA (HicA-like mRNA interferase family)
MNSREVIKRIQADGWAKVRTTGDHWHFRHPSRPGVTTVPHPKKDLPLGTIKSIEKQSGVRLR